MIAASVLGSDIVMHGVSMSDDERISIGIADACRNVKINGHDVQIGGGFRCPSDLYAGESATSYRLSMGAFAAKKCAVRYHGSPYLASRPIHGLQAALEDLGVSFKRMDDGFFTADGKGSKNIPVSVSGESSQFASSLMIYYAAMGGGRFMIRDLKSAGYLKITAECLESLGFRVYTGDEIIVEEIKRKNAEINIERDFSSAAFFMVLGSVSDRWDISISGLNRKSLQPDSAILSIIGENLKWDGDLLKVKYGIDDEITVDADENPDLCPPLAVAGIFSDSGVVIRNAERLRSKESDRESEIERLAEMFGSIVEKSGGYIRIRKGELRAPAYTDFKDHRMIMAAVIAGLASGKPVTHMNAENVSKSFPSFFDEIGKLSHIRIME